MEPAVLSALVIATGALVAAIYTARQNRSAAAATTELTERVVDREDFREYMERAKEDRVRSDERITALELRLEEEVSARQEADERAAAAEKRAIAAEQRAEKLEARVAMLEHTLEMNNIPIPDKQPQ